MGVGEGDRPMPVSNPRWTIDGVQATSFVYGRKAFLTVDVHDTPGTEVVFKLQKTTPSPPLMTAAVPVPATGAWPTTLKIPVTLAYQWPVLEKLPTTYSHFDACCKAGHTLPYGTNSWFLADEISTDLLYPPLVFTAGELLQQPVTSPVIRRDSPQFVPGNRAELLVDGPQIQAGVIAAIAAAQHHVHLDWFFFDPPVGSSWLAGWRYPGVSSRA
jgi:hypothetical protein